MDPSWKIFGCFTLSSPGCWWRLWTSQTLQKAFWLLDLWRGKLLVQRTPLKGAVDKIVLAQRFGIKQDDVMTCVWTNRLGDVICINACFNKKNHLHPIFPQLCQPHQSFLQILYQTFCQTSTSHPRNLIILGYPYHTTFIPMFLPFWFRTNGPNQIWGLAGESQSLAARLVVWYHLSIL